MYGQTSIEQNAAFAPESDSSKNAAAASEKFSFEANAREFVDRDTAERVTDRLMFLLDGQKQFAPISATEKDGVLQFNVKIGNDKAHANSLSNELEKLGYPLQVMFGSNTDREMDVKAYEKAEPLPGMTERQALDIVNTFLSSKQKHSEEVVKSWNYVRCHPANDSVACPEGPISSSFNRGYLELSGAKNEFDSNGYARLNSALKVIETNRKITVRFE